MKKIILSIVLSLFAIPPVFAAGVHGGGHGEGHGEGHHAHGSDKKKHGHGHEDHKETVGKPASPDEATRKIPVTLNDQMRIVFKKPLAEIKSGSVIQFTVTNEGKIRHEFSIGNSDEQKEHAAMMRKMPNMTHSDGNTITVESGETKTLTWRFEGKDTVVFACNIPGHFEAGMFKNVALK